MSEVSQEMEVRRQDLPSLESDRVKASDSWLQDDERSDET